MSAVLKMKRRQIAEAPRMQRARAAPWAQFGDVTVPSGECGPWRIDRFHISEDTVRLENLRHMISGASEFVVAAGDYVRLVHERRGVVMSNTPMEVRTAIECRDNATGHVLINGLGLGMVLEGVLHNSSVAHVRVVEIDADVLSLVAPHFEGQRVEFVHDDAHKYRPRRGERFEYVWHDIWDEVTEDNLPDMARLTRGYARFADKQGVWSRDIARRRARRAR